MIEIQTSSLLLIIMLATASYGLGYNMMHHYGNLFIADLISLSCLLITASMSFYRDNGGTKKLNEFTCICYDFSTFALTAIALIISLISLFLK